MIESDSKMEGTVICNSIVEVAAHYLCFILLLRNKAEALPMLEGVEII